MRPPDPAFADPRLAVLYDVFDGDRCDLDVYLALADELDARSVVDIGCGTGSLAVELARTGRTVVGVDPALASLDVALTKPWSDRVTWIHGYATALVGVGVGADLVVMTGNVAQVFISLARVADRIVRVSSGWGRVTRGQLDRAGGPGFVGLQHVSAGPFLVDSNM